MQKWEYLVVLIYKSTVISAGATNYATLEITDSNKVGQRYNIEIEKGFPPPPELQDFLFLIGQDGWEMVGVISDVNSGDNWRTLPVRLIFKRPSSSG